MTIVTIGKAMSKDFMQFEFGSDFEAWAFYASAKDSYREDDLVLTMWEEGNSDEEDC